MARDRAGTDPFSELHFTTLQRLVDEGVLPAERPADEKPGLHYWLQWVGNGCLINDGGTVRFANFAEYRRVRNVLGGGGSSHPEVILKAAAAALDGMSISRRKISALIGVHTDEDMRRVREIAGSQQRNPRQYGDANIEDLLALFDDRQRLCLEELTLEPGLDSAYLKASWVIRARDLPAGWRILAAAVLLQCFIQSLKAQTAARYLTVIEAVAQAVEGQIVVDAPALGPKLAKISPGWSEATIAGRTNIFLNIRVSCAAWLESSCDDADELIKSLPRVVNGSPARKELRRTLNERASMRTLERLEKMVDRLEIDEASMRSMREREQQVANLLLRFREVASEMIREEVEDRFFEVPELTLLPDGVSGPGKQIVMYRAMTRKRAGELAIERNPARSTYAYKESFGSLPDKFVLLYVAVKVVGETGEAHAPFFVDLYRWGLPDFPKGLSDRDREIAAEMIRGSGFTPPDPIGGLLTTPRSLKALMHVLRTHDASNGIVLIPIRELAHAMLLARLALEIAHETGKRASEILQLRPGNGLGYIIKAGRKLPFFWCRPKGKKSRVRVFFSVRVAKLMWRAIAAGHQRFAPQVFDLKGRPSLATREFQGTGRSESCPPAPYVFQGSLRALTVDELNALIQALMIGIVKLSVHDERFLFATRYARDGGTDPGLKRKLNHTSKSDSTSIYNLWPAISGIERVRRVVASRSSATRWIAG